MKPVNPREYIYQCRRCLKRSWKPYTCCPTCGPTMGRYLASKFTPDARERTQ